MLSRFKGMWCVRESGNRKGLAVTWQRFGRSVPLCVTARSFRGHLHTFYHLFCYQQGVNALCAELSKDSPHKFPPADYVAPHDYEYYVSPSTAAPCGCVGTK